MRKLDIGSVIAGLARLTDRAFLFSEGQSLFLLILALEFLRLRAAATGHGDMGTVFGLGARLVTVVMIVNTHRYILLGEPPRLRFGKRDLAYLFKTIGTILPVIGLVLCASFAFNLAGPDAIGILLALALLACTIFVYFRYCVPWSLALPATALDRKFTFEEAQRAAQGNIGALTVIAVIFLVIVLVMGGVALEVQRGAAPFLAQLGGAPALGPELLAALGSSVVDILAAMIWAGFLSFAYAALVGEQPDVAETFT